MGFLDGAKEGLKSLITRKPTPQEQQVNTSGVMEPFAPLTSQLPQVPQAEAQAPAPSPEPTITAMPSNVSEPASMPDTIPSPDLSTPVPPASPSSEQQAA